jgi:hypothetical protein
VSRLGALASGLWGKLALVAATLMAALAIVGVIRKGGADAERVKRAGADQKVRARVDAVQPPAPGVVEDRLEKGTF